MYINNNFGTYREGLKGHIMDSKVYWYLKVKVSNLEREM